MRVPSNAVITAGGRVDGPFAAAIGSPVKGLAAIRGATLLQRAIDSARGAGVRHIAVVGGAEVREAIGGEVDVVIAERSSGTENVRAALGAWTDDSPLLYLTSDMPYLHADAVRDFIERVPEGALAVPLAEDGDYDARFPGSPAHGILLGGRRVTNGGAFVIPAGAHSSIDAFAARLFAARKNVWKMAALLGPSLLLEFAMRRLTIGRLEAHALRITGVPAVAVCNAAAELAFDCDTFEDFTYACAHA